MCIFSRPVAEVAGTCIFTRLYDDGRQLIVYDMQVETTEPCAMVLPIATKRGTTEIAFHDFSGRLFFELLADIFIQRTRGGRGGVSLSTKGGGEERPVLPVQRMGHYECSFVPTRDDFDRLDECFRLPSAVFADYPEHGFVVCQLRPGLAGHPVAFTFPADGGRSWVPTRHLHDGEAKPHPFAHFDHLIYAQFPSRGRRLACNAKFHDSATRALSEREAVANPEINPLLPVYRLILRGKLPNEDTQVF